MKKLLYAVLLVLLCWGLAGAQERHKYEYPKSVILDSTDTETIVMPIRANDKGLVHFWVCTNELKAPLMDDSLSIEFVINRDALVADSIANRANGWRYAESYTGGAALADFNIFDYVDSAWYCMTIDMDGIAYPYVAIKFSKSSDSTYSDCTKVSIYEFAE